MLTPAMLLQPGDHVKVNSGQHEGQTGMVVRIEDPVCILVSDSTHEELQVFARDLTESSESATGLDRYICCFFWLTAFGLSRCCELLYDLQPTRSAPLPLGYT